MRRHSPQVDAPGSVPERTLASAPGRVRIAEAGILALVMALAGVLVSCATTDDDRGAQPRTGVGARLRPIADSAMTGGVTFGQAADGVSIAVNLGGGTPGQWRVAIHANGICTSPNGFAAGPPLLLPGTSSPAAVSVTTNSDGVGATSARLPGLRLEGPEGILGKSVVVHAGAVGSLEAVPGVANNRVACGVIETMRAVL